MEFVSEHSGLATEVMTLSDRKLGLDGNPLESSFLELTQAEEAASSRASACLQSEGGSRALPASGTRVELDDRPQSQTMATTPSMAITTTITERGRIHSGFL